MDSPSIVNPATPPKSGPPTVRSGGTPWLKLALFGCGAVTILGIVLVVVFGVIGYYLIEETAVAFDETSEAAGTGGGEADWISYVSSPDHFTGDRAENYIDFSFRYPPQWVVVQDGSTPDTPNFVKVEWATPDNYTIENFAAGYYNYPAGAPEEVQRQLTGDLLESLKAQFGAGFPNYRFVSDATGTVAGQPATGFRFSAAFEQDDDTFDLYGLVYLVPGSESRGLALIMLASELAEGVDGPEDVGEEDELAGILASLQIAP